MTVTLTTDELGRVRDEGTVVVLTGTDDATGDRVTFGADRHMFIVACGGLLDGTGRVTFEIEGWQVLERARIGTPPGTVLL
jgi:hypothetical protein